uniref:Uncharacterized protein n=1 Tax=Arundo donax TaxID=35708 RepID=A0A0A9TB55_ARUDO
MGKIITFPNANPTCPMAPLYSHVTHARSAPHARTKQCKMMRHTRGLLNCDALEMQNATQNQIFYMVGYE